MSPCIFVVSAVILSRMALRSLLPWLSVMSFWRSVRAASSIAFALVTSSSVRETVSLI